MASPKAASSAPLSPAHSRGVVIDLRLRERALKSQLLRSEADNRSLRARLIESQSLWSGHDKELVECHRQEELLSAQILQLRRENGELAERCQQQQDECEHVRRELRAATDGRAESARRHGLELADAKATTVRLTAEVRELREKNARFVALAGLVDNHVEKFRRLKETKRSLQAELADRNAQISAMRIEIAERLGIQKEAQLWETALEKEIENLREQLRESQDFAKGCLQRESQLEQEIAALREEASDKDCYREEIQNLNDAKQGLEQKVEQLEILRERGQFENGELAKQLRILRQSIENSAEDDKRRNMEWGQMLDQKCHVENSVRTFARLLAEELDRATRDNGVLKQTILSLQGQVDAAHENNTRLIDLCWDNGDWQQAMRGIADECESTVAAEEDLGVRDGMRELLDKAARALVLDDDEQTASEVGQWEEEEIVDTFVS
jgi:chromosome segregation ATPase